MSGQVSIGFLEALGSQEVGFSKVDFYKRQVVFGWPMRLSFVTSWILWKKQLLSRVQWGAFSIAFPLPSMDPSLRCHRCEAQRLPDFTLVLTLGLMDSVGKKRFCLTERLGIHYAKEVQKWLCGQEHLWFRYHWPWVRGKAKVSSHDTLKGEQEVSVPQAKGPFKKYIESFLITKASYDDRNSQHIWAPNRGSTILKSKCVPFSWNSSQEWPYSPDLRLFKACKKPAILRILGCFPSFLHMAGTLGRLQGPSGSSWGETLDWRDRTERIDVLYIFINIGNFLEPIMPYLCIYRLYRYLHWSMSKQYIFTYIYPQIVIYQI